MGLSICRSIVEAHGGRLWADANKPRGTVFQFTLPGAERTRELSSGGLLNCTGPCVPHPLSAAVVDVRDQPSGAGGGFGGSVRRRNGHRSRSFLCTCAGARFARFTPAIPIPIRNQPPRRRDRVSGLCDSVPGRRAGYL